MRPLLSLAIGILGVATLANPSSAQIFNDPFSEYVEREITITPGAGNAKDANSAIHTIDPWPAYAGYTRIPGRGEHAVNSIQRMNRLPDPFVARQGAGTVGGSTGAGAGAGTGAGTGGGAPMQPISSGDY